MANKSSRRAHEHKVLQWLRVGAVAAGVGAAVVAGQGVAVADTGTESETSSSTDTSTESTTGTDTDAAEPEPEPEADVDTPAVVVNEPRSDTAKKPSLRRATTARTSARAAAAPPATSRITSQRTTSEPTATTHITTTAPQTAPDTTAAISSTAAVAATPTLPPQASIEITKVTPSPPSLARPIRGLVLGVLGIFGFNPNPAPGTTNNPLLEALWGTYRRIESIIGNETPTARTATITTSEIVDDTVEITGSVTFTDPNNDTLRYTATNGAHGTVIINPGGTFTYTPTDPNYVGTDTFTITANDDKNFHLHGPLAFLKSNWGHSNTATLTITVAEADNQAPVITNHTGPSAPGADGTVTGSFTITDPNGDSITLTTSQTTKGTVGYVVTPDATTPGVYTATYTYTPNFATRLAASYAQTDTTEAFTFTATDGENTSGPLSVSAAIEQFAPHTVIATVPVGTNSVGLAVSPDGKTAYAANWGDNTLSVIDVATNTVTATIAVGVNPLDVVISPDGANAYVLNNNAGSISVIDTATNTVTATATITDIATRPQSMAITPDGSTIYVGDGLYGSVSVINTASKTVTTRITTVHSPIDLVVSPDGKRLYVAGGSVAQGPVTVIDTATNRRVTEIIVGNLLRGIAVSPDGKTIYATVTTPMSYGLAIIDTATNTVSGGITLGSAATQPAVSPDGTIAYVTHIANGLVSVVDTATGAVITTIPIGTDAHPTAITFSPNADFAYTANNSADGSLSVIWTGLASHHAAPTVTVEAGEPDTTTGAVVLTVTTADVDGDDVTLTVSAPAKGSLVNNGDGTFTYTPSQAARLAATGSTVTESITFTASDAHGDTSSDAVDIAVLGCTANAIIATIDLGAPNDGTFILVSADGKTAYSVARQTGRVVVIDTATNTVITTVTVGSAPLSPALHPDGTTLWVPSIADQSVTVIDTATNTVLRTLTAVGSTPYSVTFSPDGAYAYIAQSGQLDTANVTVVDTATGTIIATVETTTRNQTSVISPDGSTLYVTAVGSSGRGYVKIIDTATNTVISTIAEPGESAVTDIAISPDGSTVYVTTQSEDAGVLVIDTATNTLTTTIATPVTPSTKIAVSPDGSTVYVTSTAGGVMVIDTATNTVRTTIPVTKMFGVALSPDGTAAYITTGFSNVVLVIATGLAPYTPPAAV